MDKTLLTIFTAMILSDGGVSVHGGRGKRGKDYEVYFIQKYKEPVMYFKHVTETLFGIPVKRERMECTGAESEAKKSSSNLY